MKKIIVLIMVAAFVLPTIAQIGQEDPNKVQFQSTSTMQVSGSALASQPMLNEDGTAYNPASSAAPATSGPRRISGVEDPTKDAKDPMPIGDAVLPLMIMALAFGGVIYLRRRKRA